MLQVSRKEISFCRGLMLCLFGSLLTIVLSSASVAGATLRVSDPEDEDALPSEALGREMETYCLDCHSGSGAESDFDFEEMLEEPFSKHLEKWEKAIGRLRLRQMPPPDAERPTEETYRLMMKNIAEPIDAQATRQPQTGNPDTLRRLTRYEYQNAIRDLFQIQVDASQWLPLDEISHGFDNITVGQVSPTLLNRYLNAAQSISRMALRRPSTAPLLFAYRIAPDATQERHVDGLPLGTRGGLVAQQEFSETGIYEIRIRLTRDRNEHVESLKSTHQLELLMDGQRLTSFKLLPVTKKAKKGSKNPTTHASADKHLSAKVWIEAGKHDIGAVFLPKSESLDETQRQPLNVSFNLLRHARKGPAIYQVTVTGPIKAADDAAPQQTDSPVALLTPDNSIKDPQQQAKKVLAKLMRRAYRRPVVEADFEQPIAMFRSAFAEAKDYHDAMELAVSSVLVNPNFLFRIERTPATVAPDTAFPISNLELASRLSFFLWSSLPDEELLQLAEQKKLFHKATLNRQVKRMLNDDRSKALVENFADQWLYTRNLESFTPNQRSYPDFDDNLRQAMRRETQLFVGHLIKTDASALDCIKADYTFLNERLAKHYDIPGVYGDRFRHVALKPEYRRGGLLKQASVLSVTSYATRTSPVLRGKWILENILGTPPPPPPPDVAALSDDVISNRLPVRQRLAQHREDATCASCHNLIDPIGLTFEGYDAVGRWREIDNELPVDHSGGLPDGSIAESVDDLQQAILDNPEIFVETIVAKLLTYGTGRILEPKDKPAIRKIVSESTKSDYRFSSLINSIVNSVPFQMRMSE